MADFGITDVQGGDMDEWQADDWRRLWAVVDAARINAKMSWRAFYREAGVSEPTMVAMRKHGQPVQLPEKIAGIEDACGWKRGSVERVLNGLEPEVVATPSQPEHSDNSDIRELVRAVRMLADQVGAQEARFDRIEARIERLAPLPHAEAVTLPRRD